MTKKGKSPASHRTRPKKRREYCPPVVKKHTARETIQILTGAGVGSSTATFAAT